MEIVDTTLADDDKTDTTFHAGVELVNSLRQILKAYGLGEEDAVGVLLVASGGILITNDVTPSQYLQDLVLTSMLWHSDGQIPTLSNIKLIPVHSPEMFDEVEQSQN